MQRITANVQVHLGDCREILPTLPPASVQAVITSPPYWRKRDYGISPSVWGGSPDCHHDWDDQASDPQPHGDSGRGGNLEGGRENQAQNRIGQIQASTCRLCGAWLGYLGLEMIHDCLAWARAEPPCNRCYTCHLRTVFAKVRRVLRPDGLLWLNLGDSAIGSNLGISSSGRAYAGPKQATNRGSVGIMSRQPDWSYISLKAKDIAAIPWRVALALQADGWFLRSGFPWVKRNALPESVRDRPTLTHEYWFMLSTSSRCYYDVDNVRLPHMPDSQARALRRRRLVQESGYGSLGKQAEALDAGFGRDHAYAGMAAGRSGIPPPQGRQRRTTDWWFESLDLAIEEMEAYTLYLRMLREEGGLVTSPEGEPLGIDVSITGFPGAHYATFPPDLIRPMIQASTPEAGCCAICGKPWVDSTGREPQRRATNESEPACSCGGGTIPCTILDPFAGTGTVGLEAHRLARTAILIEISPQYTQMALERINGDAPMFPGAEIVRDR